MLTKRLSWGVGILSVLMLGGLLFMAIKASRVAAHKMQSRNNLKQITLALHNYEATFARLPAGCDKAEKHGWPVQIHNYMEASNWGNDLDKQVGWEHPFNSHKFRTRMHAYLNPNATSTYTSEGYSLTHYLANSSLFYRGSNVKFSDIDAGLSNVMFVGEIGSRYQPFGYPYNWRTLEWPLNTKDGGFGGWSDGAQFGKGDGAVQFVSMSVDPSVLEQLAKATATPDSQLTRIPDRLYRCVSYEFGRTLGFINEPRKRTKGTSASVVYFDSNQRAEVIVFRGGSWFKSLGIDSDAILSNYPEARVVDFGDVFDLRVAARTAKLKNLEALTLREMTDTEQVIEILRALPRLRFLKGSFEAELLDRLRVALPECDVSSTFQLHQPTL